MTQPLSFTDPPMDGVPCAFCGHEESDHFEEDGYRGCEGAENCTCRYYDPIPDAELEREKRAEMRGGRV